MLKDEELRDNHVLASAESSGWNYMPRLMVQVISMTFFSFI